MFKVEHTVLGCITFFCMLFDLLLHFHNIHPRIENDIERLLFSTFIAYYRQNIYGNVFAFYPKNVTTVLLSPDIMPKATARKEV